MTLLLLLAASGSPLLDVAARLRCAPDERSARAALADLHRARSGALSLPDEQLERAPPLSLRAGTLDAVVHELHAIAAHFPSLRDEAAQLLASWDACPLEGGAWDVVARGATLARTPAAGPFPLGGAGFADAAGEQSLLPPEKRACWKPRVAAAGAYPFAWAPACADPPPDQPPFAAGRPPAPSGQRPALTSLSAQREEVPVPGATPASPGIAPSFVPGKRIGLTPFLAWFLEGRYAAGVAGTWSPVKYFFVRGELGWRAGLDHEPFYAWGFGYDDWHPGSFSLQINDWGPSIPSQGIDWQHAVVDLGYKLPRPCLDAFCFATYVALDVPLKDTVYLRGIFTVTFEDVWFARLGADVVFDGHVRWIYGIGRADWHAFGVNLSYDNWGPNVVPQPYFKQHGVITLSLNL